MSKFKHGDWVIYDPGYKQEIGRVTEAGEQVAWVCCSQGCTAAATLLVHLRKATEQGVAKMGNPLIGFHRFDDDCPSYEPEACFAFCPSKGISR